MKISTQKIALATVALLYASLTFAQTSFKSLNYLYSISGQQTASGMHNREPNSTPARWTNEIYNTTGKYPALWSGDFLFQADNISNRQTMINEAKAQWARGALINIMFHACPPTQAEPCAWSGGVQSRLSDAQWNELITNGTALNNNWKARLDKIAVFLQDLKNNGVEVLFRPLHEMNQGAFWWGGRPGANGTRRLFQITRDYLVNTKGLTNLIWVWNVQDFGSLSSDLTNYNPGSSYWDVLSMDMYWSDGTGYTTAKYNALVNASGGKPIAIGECEVLPTPGELSAQPRWTFFMGWSELIFQRNSTSAIQNTFWASNVITLDEKPGWNTSNPAPNLAYNRPVNTSSNENSTNVGARAVDADGNTRWSSAYANNQHIIVDLGANYNVNRVRLAWEAAYARDYQVQFSTNNSTWTTVRDVWGKSSSAADNLTGLSGVARYVKIYCINRATSYGFSLFEFEVYGTAAGARLSAEEESPEHSLDVYPNPASDQVTVKFAPQWQTGDSRLSLVTPLGKVLSSEPIRAAEHTLPLGALPAGLYIIDVSNSRQRMTRKILKR